MTKIAILIISASVFAACSSSSVPEQAVNSPAQSNSNSLVVSSRSLNAANSNSAAPAANVPQTSETKTKWKQVGNAIDTSAFDAEIAQAEKNQKAKPNDESAKKALAEAYTKRGVALTEVRQYPSALGDYRKALKLDAENKEAKSGMDEIIRIYESLNREYPSEGEEPPPLPFKKT